MGKMKAIIFTNYGSVEVLQLKEVEKTPPLDNEVLINIFATSVTASDCSIRGFKLPLSMWNPGRLTSGITKPRKAIHGLVLSGVIEGVDNNARQLKNGDRIFAHTYLRLGTYAEYKCLPETSEKTLMPTNNSFEEAAAIPYSGTPALFYLKKANI